MNLHRKLLLAQLPVILALLVVAIAAWYVAARFGAAPGDILHQNFRSFDAGRGMLRSVEEIELRMLSVALREEPLATRDIESFVEAFERDLRLQDSNVTEPGEAEATARVHELWAEYRAGLDPSEFRADLEVHRQRRAALRGSIERILDLNRDAMHVKSDAARRSAERFGASLIALTVIALLVALVITGVWMRRVVAPLRVLERAVHRMSDGDFAARIRVEGRDEIALLSLAFNGMADRLALYRQSSLGELLDANNRLESVMDSLNDAVIVYDLGGAPLAHNEVAARWLGSDRLELDALPEALREPVRAAFEHVRLTAEVSESASLGAAIEVAGSPDRWLLISATPVRTHDDSIAGVTVALRDVTRSRRLEGFKGDLVAVAAHELRTPLTSLHMAVHLCLEYAAGPLSERQEDLLTAARQDCERLQTVVDELLEMARLEAGGVHLNRDQVNVAELLRETAARHEAQVRQRGKTLELLGPARSEAASSDSLLTMPADPGRLRHVLDNLIENALIHAGEHGRIALGFERCEGGVRIFVDDDGPGIPDELGQRVFAKFFRLPGTTKQGSGLGLSIVQDIVRAHGGEVGVERSAWGGARFWFSIPLDQARG